jgi:DNA-binding transcriptional regulator YhcF (GntR family)
VAVDLAINPNTGVRAYRELEIREVLETQQGSMVIVPSSAVETMGLGGTLATAALGGSRPR